MKLRDGQSAENKASTLAKKLVDKGQGEKVSKMALHAKKVLGRHEQNIQDHMKRAPGEDADPADIHAHKSKLQKMEKYHNYWSGVYSGFNNHDPFWNGLTKDSLKIKESEQSEQSIIAESINSLIKSES
jgi:hypothetical protein